MSLSRAFTTRKARLANDLGDLNTKSPQRSTSVRYHPNPQMLRNKISAPLQLVHTTNMLSYNAPDLPKHVLRNKASTRSEDSETPSESTSEAPSITETTPPTSPDVSPIDECPGPEPNHLSTYFMIPSKAQQLAQLSEAPAIPKRSPSHTKQNSYEAIARNRSVSRMSKDSDRSVSTKGSYTFSRSSSTSTRASSTGSMSPAQKEKPVSPAPPVPSPPTFQRAFKEPHQSHPFGQELAQVTELAEEYSTTSRSTDSQDDEDNMYIRAKGLVKFTADDYLNDVQSLLTSFFPDVSHAKPTTPLWI